MRPITQTVLLVGASLLTIPRRVSAVVVTVVGTVVVVAVLASLLALEEGLHVWSTQNSRSDRVVVLSRGALTAGQSSLTREEATSIVNSPYVRKGSDGKPLATVETAAALQATNLLGQPEAIFAIGLSNHNVLPEITLVDGRWFKPGVREFIVSRLVQKTYRHFRVGDKVRSAGDEWTIVGTFQATGGTSDQFVFTDAETMLSAYGRNTFQEVAAVLNSGVNFRTFASALTSDPALNVDVFTEAENRENNLGDLPGLLRFVSLFVGSLLGVAALCGAVSSLYTTVDTRRREIATLRAVGFGSLPVMSSVLIEGLILALLAAMAGVVLAWLFFNGKIVNTQNLTFPMAVSKHVIALSICWALAIGLVGGLMPAIRASRLTVAAALRDV